MAATPRSFNVLTGPTASGKTAWLLKRAETVPLAIISADSRQIYCHMDIGTGKTTPAEQLKVPQFGLNLLEPFNNFSVYQYYYYSVGILTQLELFEGEVWFCGGTGLYLRAILEPLEWGAVPLHELRPAIDTALRTQGSRVLASRLGLSLNDPDNPVRVLRAIERWYASAGFDPRLAQVVGLPDCGYNTARSEGKRLAVGTLTGKWRCNAIAVLDPGREALQERIESRVSRMFHEGLLDEIARLVALGYEEAPVVGEGIGYAEALAVHRGEMNLDAAIARTVVRTRQYAKRQRTYFRGRGWPFCTAAELPFANPKP